MATKPRPLVSAIEVVYLYVTDVDRSIAFYRDALGLDFASYDETWAETRLGPVRFALHKGEQARPGTVIPDFRVGDIDAVVAHLHERGITVEDVVREEYGSFANFTDPDGYTIGLFQPPS